MAIRLPLFILATLLLVNGVLSLSVASAAIGVITVGASLLAKTPVQPMHLQ